MNEKENRNLNNIMVAITVRIEEIDLEFKDVSKRLEEAKKVDHSCYAAGYESGILAGLHCEKVSLIKIMQGKFDINYDQ
jgi:hypothetical protein